MYMHMYIYEYMQIYIYTSTYIYTCICTYAQTYPHTNAAYLVGATVHLATFPICTYIHIYTYKHLYIHTHRNTNRHICVCVSAWMCIHTYTHTHIHIYKHIYTYMYTCTHIHIYVHVFAHVYTHAYINICIYIYKIYGCRAPKNFSRYTASRYTYIYITWRRASKASLRWTARRCLSSCLRITSSGLCRRCLYIVRVFVCVCVRMCVPVCVSSWRCVCASLRLTFAGSVCIFRWVAYLHHVQYEESCVRLCVCLCVFLCVWVWGYIDSSRRVCAWLCLIFACGVCIFRCVAYVHHSQYVSCVCVCACVCVCEFIMVRRVVFAHHSVWPLPYWCIVSCLRMTSCGLCGQCLYIFGYDIFTSPSVVCEFGIFTLRCWSVRLCGCECILVHRIECAHHFVWPLPTALLCLHVW